MKDERLSGPRSLSRRRFLKSCSGAAASMFLLESCGAAPDEPPDDPPLPPALNPRSRITNPFVDGSGRPLLVCVSGTDFEAMLAAGISALGGLDKLIGPDVNVLIKPNCNAAEPYPAVSSAASVVSIIEEVKKVTGGTIQVGDQGYQSYDRVYGFMGLDTAVLGAGGTLLGFGPTRRVRRSGWPEGKPDFQVYTPVYDAPVIINACQLKRHNWAAYSCAIKNMVGAVEGAGAESTRAYLHYESPNLQAEVAEIAGLLNPELSIVDARSILTQGGPFYEDGVVVEARKIVLCGDIVAADAYCVRILEDHDPGFSSAAAGATLSRAESLGLGTADLTRVQVIEISV